MDTDRQRRIDAIIAKSAFRRNVHNLVPEGSRRILDFGCGDGSLALRLIRDKGCAEVYGLDVNKDLTAPLRGLLDGVLTANIETDENLPDSFAGFFNFLILHDVVEHFYDPWLCLAKLRRFLSPQGRLVLATPNFQFWDFAHKVLCGDFPYGPGLWHTGHLRWFTARSLVEMLTLTGYFIETLYLEIPYPLDRERLTQPGPRLRVQLPPEEIADGYPDAQRLSVSFPRDVSRGYPLFLAHKLIAVCGSRTDMVVTPAPVVYNCPQLATLRAALDNPFDTFDPPPMELLIGDWN